LAVERMTGMQVECGLVQGSLFRAAHTRILAARFPPVQLIEAASEPAAAPTGRTPGAGARVSLVADVDSAGYRPLPGPRIGAGPDLLYRLLLTWAFPPTDLLYSLLLTRTFPPTDMLYRLLLTWAFFEDQGWNSTRTLVGPCPMQS
jgi:hypothetical protein